MRTRGSRDFVTELNAIDERVSQGPPDLRRHRYEQLNQVQRDLYDVNRFNFECICGGLGVFFTSSAGEHWRETIEALGRVGTQNAHAILQRACSLFPGGAPSTDPDEFDEQANDSVLQDQIGALHAQLDTGEMSEAMERYWLTHLAALPAGGVE